MTRSFIACLLLCAAGSARAQTTPLLASPTDRGVVLRWVWGEGQRPAGYFIERRTSSTSPWTRLTPRPITRIRERAAARALIGAEFDRYSGLLFPETPGAGLADPETFRGMLLLSADLDAGVAQVLGLRYDDTGVAAGSAYEYRLVELTASGERVAGSTGAVVAGGYRASRGPRGLVALSGSRGTALRWTAEPRFSAYHVYRGTRGDLAAAQRLNDAPIILFTRDDGSAMEASATFFTDTAPPSDSAFYWLRGVDMFARVSEASAPAASVYRAPVVIAPPLLPQTRIAGDTAIITWQASRESRATRFQLWRSDSSAGPFVKVGQPVRAPTREQRDPGRRARRVIWYRVTALDDAGHESEPSALALAEVPDREPPGVPDSLTAIADTGRITLRWRHVAATDLRGYRVYRSIDGHGSFALLSVTPTAAAQFVDTIPARADHPFFYRITAVDSAFNESRTSATHVVSPPDATPPSGPRISRIQKLDGAIAVSWLPNPEPDVTEYRLRFRAKGENAWRALPQGVPAAQLSDTIGGLTPGRSYEITLSVMDDARNMSAPAPVVEASPAKPRAIDRPDLRSVVFEQGQRAVVVTWSAPRNAQEMFVLRRETEGGGDNRALRLVGAAEAGASRFVDRSVRAGVEYEYVVRARDTFGNEAQSRGRRVSIPGEGSGS